MDGIFSMIAACGQEMGRLGGWPGGLALSLFVAGLAGSLVHCAGMCGPFVLGQVVADSSNLVRYGEWRRLAGATLVPYHLGRATTYSLLGAVAGGATAVFAATPAFRWLSAGLLILGAGVVAFQLLGLTLHFSAPWSGWLSGVSRRFSASRHWGGRYALGVALGFLPCGMIYGALGMAAGSGSPVQGAAAMAAFAAGTVPVLVAVGWGGMLLHRRFQGAMRYAAIPLLIVNLALVTVLASQRL
ncbi:MAG TPA: sulfite exporter TauE/SafE family protein [Reyranella sp.]|nr:sulfite exporter TauE/SafE family protein [Reyranella sp.]